MKYNELLLSAIIPAVIYYMGILFQIQMRAEKMGMQGTPKDQLPKMSQVMKEYGHLALPIIFLVYMLFFSGKTVIMAAFYTIVFTIIVAQCRKNTRMTFQDILDAMVASAKSTVSVAIACACVGIIVGSCSITGFALNMAKYHHQHRRKEPDVHTGIHNDHLHDLRYGSSEYPVLYHYLHDRSSGSGYSLVSGPGCPHVLFLLRNVRKPDTAGCPCSFLRQQVSQAEVR